MAGLTEDKNRHRVIGDIQGYPVLSNSIIFEGSVVGLNSGYARSYIVGDMFVGFCEQKVDNSSGANGDLDVRVLSRGVMVLDVESALITDVGRPVYTDDGVLFTIINALGIKIGNILRYVSSGVCEVSFDPVNSPEIDSVITFPMNLFNLVTGFVVSNYIVDFHCRVKSMDFIVNTSTTPTGKSAVLNLTTPILLDPADGGSMLLTSSNCTPVGNIVVGDDITCCAGIVKGDAISIYSNVVAAFPLGTGSFNIILGR